MTTGTVRFGASSVRIVSEGSLIFVDSFRARLPERSVYKVFIHHVIFAVRDKISKSRGLP